MINVLDWPSRRQKQADEMLEEKQFTLGQSSVANAKQEAGTPISQPDAFGSFVAR